MNAVEFVKERGWDRASELVNECPAEMSYVGKCGFSKINHKGFVCKGELKILVEAWEFVQAHGGVSNAHEYVYSHDPYGLSMHYNDLSNKIYLVEQCHES